MAEIVYQQYSYPFREVNLNDQCIAISTIALGEKLLTEGGQYVSEEAVNIDERIYYYVSETQIGLSDEE
jgi:hypothetical protein